ncbi:hypothetical protein BBJ28_00026568, partial [Nothophytophthora sp. Chile5]
AIQAWLEDPVSCLKPLESETERAEELALLQFERRHNGCLYSSDSAVMDGFLSEEGSKELPLWFIPQHQVELGAHIADGSIGAVYEGQWLGTEVVVKQVLTDQDGRENRAQFRREVDLWFNLNHENLIKLYGGCHEGRPFFVCERANSGTLVFYLKGRTRKEVWRAIWRASLGLQHLHDRGIVHGDLKGNNILVSDDKAKLADFGLSVVVSPCASLQMEKFLRERKIKPHERTHDVATAVPAPAREADTMR